MPRSRAPDPPLYGFPGRTYEGSQHLNPNPEHIKNVPIFDVLRSAEKIGRAGSAEPLPQFDQII